MREEMETLSNFEEFRTWLRDIPSPAFTHEDHGIGHWEMHGRRGFDSKLVMVLDDRTTGPFTCTLTLQDQALAGEVLHQIENILDDEGRDATLDVHLEGIITFPLGWIGPAKIELYWVEDT